MALQGYVGDFALFGDDYETPDGTAIRDYIHVGDLARAHIVALEFISNGTESGHFNLGTGSGFSVQEIISTIEKVTGQSIDVVRKPRTRGNLARSCRGSRRREVGVGLQTKHVRSEQHHRFGMGLA